METKNATDAQRRRERVFREWLIPVERGLFALDAKKMPRGAAKAFGDFRQAASNKSPDHPDAAKAAEDFERITGFSASDLAEFQFKLIELSRRK